MQEEPVRTNLISSLSVYFCISPQTFIQLKYISKTEIRAGEGSALCLNWCDSKEDVKNCDEGGVHANCGLRTEGEDYIGLDRILFFSHEYIITNCELLS